MNCDKSDIREEIELHIEKLLGEVANINSKYKLSMYIMERTNDSLRELNISPAFFSLTLDSLINNVIIGLAKIYESYKRSGGSIDKLLNKIEQNIKDIQLENITTNTINKHRNYINISESIIQNLFIWRDKYFAHFDKKYFLGSHSLAEDAKLTYSGISELIEKAGEILNEYYSELSGKYYSIEALNYDDVNKILSILKSYNEKIDQFKFELNSRKK